MSKIESLFMLPFMDNNKQLEKEQMSSKAKMERLAQKKIVLYRIASAKNLYNLILKIKQK